MDPKKQLASKAQDIAFTGLDKHSIQKELEEQKAPKQKKASSKKSASSVADELEFLTPAPPVKITAAAVKEMTKVTKKQKDDKDFKVKQELIGKIKDFMVAFPQTVPVIDNHHPEFNKKPHDMTTEALNDVMSSLLKELNKPHVQEMTKSLVFAICKVIETGGITMGKPWAGASLRVAAMFDNPRIAPLLTQLGLKYGLANLPTETLLLYEIWNAFEETSNGNQKSAKTREQLGNKRVPDDF